MNTVFGSIFTAASGGRRVFGCIFTDLFREFYRYKQSDLYLYVAIYRSVYPLARYIVDGWDHNPLRDGDQMV